METATARRWVAILGVVLAALVLLLGGRMWAISRGIQTFEASRRAGLTAFGSPIVALELPTNAADIRLVVGDDPEDRARMAEIQRLDSWFVPAYAGLFLTLLWLARRRGSAAGARMAAVAALAVAVAAVGDILENRAIADALAPGGVDDAGADAVRRAALVKWTALYVACGWIGLLLMTRKYRGTRSRFLLAAAGNLFLFACLVGLGVWVVPSVVTAGTWFLALAVPLLLGVVLARPMALDDPPAERPPDPSRLDLAKGDHLLPLAQAADEEIAVDPGGPLAKELARRLKEHAEDPGRRALPRVDDADDPRPSDVSREARLELLADMLVSDRRADAERLARARPELFPASIDRLEAQLVEVLSRGAEGSRLRATLKAHGFDEARLGDLRDGAPRQALRLALRLALLLRPSLAVRLAEDLGSAVPFALAQEAELAEVRSAREWRGRAAAEAVEPPAAREEGYAPRRAFGLDLVGLAFSGGGIRSATFNLGVLQALSDLRLLGRIDYLSTVSGGGYIGSWLASWSKRLVDGVAEVQRRLSPERSPEPNAPRSRPIRFLREYSNYLAPRKGLLGADTWGLIALWLRNTLLIQSVLVLFLSTILLLPRLVGLVAGTSPGWPGGFVWGMSALGILVFLVLCLRTGTELGRFSREDAERLGTSLEGDWAPPSKAGPEQVQATIVLPGFGFGMALAIPLWLWARPGGVPPVTGAGDGGLLAIGGLASALFAVGVLVVEGRAGYARSLLRRSSGIRAKAASAGVVALATVVPAAVGGALVATLASVFQGWTSVPGMASAAGVWHVVTLGPPALVGIVGLAFMLHIGLVGRGLDDDRREWTSRLGAWLLIWSGAWLAAFGVAVYGPWLVTLIERRVAAAGGLAWIASTAWGAYVGQSASGAPAGGEKRSPGWSDAAARLTPYVFVVGLLLALSWGMHLLVVRLDLGAADWDALSWSSLHFRYWQHASEAGLPLTAALIAALGVATLLLAWRVDVNEFSLHHLYKNRLVRCYLGATRQTAGDERRPHPFTGFDRDDDLPLASLRVSPASRGLTAADPGSVDLRPYVGPMLIVNCALNLVKGEDLAWQERKAQSFVFTPLFSGYEHVPTGARRSHEEPTLAEDGLRPTASYAYRGGISLGTAFAISGAAASPNMGYHSSAPMAFLMTMFNVRLGWWMGNPRQEATCGQASPTFGLSALLAELTGNTTNSSRFVNLSDGGHFENLGLYELVRRRCRFVIACDAGQDPEIEFDSLGSAIRKCRTDLGVEIRIRPEAIRFTDEKLRRSRVHAAMGDIVYPGGERGLLCYLKSSITGDEPGDVLEYALRVKEFPHESTADQFFDESQFESYRQLGHHVTHAVLDAAARAVDRETTPHREYWRGLFAGLVRGREAALATQPWDGRERRSGVERRKPPVLIPERRSGRDRRASGA